VIEFADFHRLPGDAPERDNQLADDELITAVELPAPRFQQHSHYLKIRDRASYAFALVSVAAAVELDGDVIRDVRIALGGVAHKPWRDTAVEQSLKGQPVSRENFVAAADAMLRNAQPLAHNAFKIKLARRAIVRALSDATLGGNA
jgi:xanthine dehydrogenase YagS FAD-binding subunit